MKILLDSDCLFALSVINDVHHNEATRLIKSSKKSGAEFYTLNLIIQEAATVISRKRTQKDAVRFLNNFNSIVDTIIALSPECEKDTWQLFLKQKHDKTSFIDCANMVVLEKYHLDKIASFDKFYPKKLLLV